MELHKPPRLSKGDIIGIAAPAGAFDAAAFHAGVEFLKGEGYHVRYRDDISAKHRYFAGDDARRTKEMQELLSDADVKAIVCARGGYGTQRILPHLDITTITDTPKILVGYSDLTALQGFLYQRMEWGTFYGPTLTRHLRHDTPRENWEWLLRACATPEPLGPLPSATLRVIQPGTATGPLVGGCLSLISDSIGTLYDWPLAGGICFLEDVGEKVYALDRMLTHLMHAKKFHNVQGVIFGTLGLAENEPAPEQLDAMLADIFKDFPGPVIAGLAAGHCDPQLTLPVGCQATLTSAPACLTIEEAAVL